MCMTDHEILMMKNLLLSENNLKRFKKVRNAFQCQLIYNLICGNEKMYYDSIRVKVCNVCQKCCLYVWCDIQEQATTHFNVLDENGLSSFLYFLSILIKKLFTVLIKFTEPLIHLFDQPSGQPAIIRERVANQKIMNMNSLVI